MQEPNVQAHVQSMLRFCFICFESGRVEFVINIVRANRILLFMYSEFDQFYGSCAL